LVEKRSVQKGSRKREKDKGYEQALNKNSESCRILESAERVKNKEGERVLSEVCLRVKGQVYLSKKTGPRWLSQTVEGEAGRGFGTRKVVAS